MGSPLSEISGFYHSLAMNAPNAISLFVCAVADARPWDWGMTLILVVSVVLTVISTNSGHGKLRDLMQDFQDTESKVIGRVADIFRGNRDVKMYAIEDKMSATFDQTADVLRQKVYDRDLKTHHVNMRQEAVGIVCFILVCLVSAGRYMNGHLTRRPVLHLHGGVRRAPGAGAVDVPARRRARARRRRAPTGSTTCSTPTAPRRSRAAPSPLPASTTRWSPGT